MCIDKYKKTIEQIKEKNKDQYNELISIQNHCKILK